MEFILKHFDTDLIKFSATMDTSQPEITILWENKENHHLYPLDLLGNVEWIASCLKRRTIPKNRAFVYEFLSKKV